MKFTEILTKMNEMTVRTLEPDEKEDQRRAKQEPIVQDKLAQIGKACTCGGGAKPLTLSNHKATCGAWKAMGVKPPEEEKKKGFFDKIRGK